MLIKYLIHLNIYDVIIFTNDRYYRLLFKSSTPRQTLIQSGLYERAKDANPVNMINDIAMLNSKLSKITVGWYPHPGLVLTSHAAIARVGK